MPCVHTIVRVHVQSCVRGCIRPAGQSYLETLFDDVEDSGLTGATELIDLLVRINCNAFSAGVFPAGALPILLAAICVLSSTDESLTTHSALC